jgi:peptidyl-prolyl cis-trans isomerase D
VRLFLLQKTLGDIDIMLQSIREKTQGIIAWFIVALITIPFALWGVQEYLGLNKSPVVAEIEGLEITKDILQRRFLAQKQQMQALYGKNFNSELFSDELMKKTILEQMLEQQAKLNRLKDSGFRVGDKQLGEHIRKMPQFQDPTGFSQAKYRNFVLSQRMDVLSYEESVRINLMKSQLSDGISNSSFITNSEKAYFAKLKLQKRDIAYAVVKAESFSDQVQVSDEEIQSYYDDNKDKYINPEKLQAEYILISMADMGEQHKPTEAEIKQYYQDKKAQYTTPEQRKISHILIQVPVTATPEQEQDAKKKADDIYAQIKQGADFAEMANQHSADPGSSSKGGDLGYVSRGMNSNPTVEDTIFGLNKGEVSTPIRSDFGYQIIKLVDIKAEVVKPYAEVKDELSKELQTARAEAAFSEKTDELLAATNEDLTTLAPVAEQLGVNLYKTDTFTRDAVPEVFQSQEIQSLLFDRDFIEQGYNSEVMQTANNGLIVFRVTEFYPQSFKPLTEVKALITAELVKTKSQELAISEGEDYVTRLNKGMNLEQLAVQEKLIYKSMPALTRDSREGISAVIVSQAFSMAKPGVNKPVYAWVQLPDGDVAIIALTAVDENITEAHTMSVDSELRSNIQSLESIMATDHMKFDADIERHPENF